jgi:GTP-binding protein
MTTLRAEFALSAAAPKGCPRWNRVEVALAGRSNVGKSSLLNALVARTELARTSKTPGRTRLINFFTVGESLALADLPGYGYAKMSHEEAAKIAAMMRDYLANRKNLAAIVLLIDSRRGPTGDELDLASMVRERGLELIIAATKADKLRRSERASAIRQFAPLHATPILCSTHDGEGIEELRLKILAQRAQIRPAPRKSAVQST